jgi:hypothetical protein
LNHKPIGHENPSRSDELFVAVEFGVIEAWQNTFVLAQSPI